MNPYGRLRVGARAALRRRKGWAALLMLRRAIRASLQLHRSRSLDAGRAYDAEAEMKKIDAYYKRAIRRVRERWPSLSLLDERAEP
ncbi:MAG: hypothetical protein JWM53_3017 [bacterium]|nr:hypothetical protein [bacterium]